MEFTPKIETVGLNLYYGDFLALQDVNITIPGQNITSVIGPSGCGKSTLLRCFNRMNDLIEHTKVEGKIVVNGRNILEPDMDLISLRKRVGMVFQRPNVFDLSIYNNLRFGLRIHRMLDGKDEVIEAIRQGLEHVGLWG
ncbi:MAG: ATP-binding cassette domain-containing protein, partial [Planctomycetota bacterium]|nr:ATP-binding cassette domain-containing protein [Planctomycetota bacterium]